MNVFASLKAEAATLYEKLNGHQEITALLHRVVTELEAFVEREATVIGATAGAFVGGPVGAVIGAAVTTVVATEAPKLAAAVEQKADSEVPK